MTYQDIVNNFASNPRDIPTAPVKEKEPLWFHVVSDGIAMYVVSAEEHTPSSRISCPRKLDESKFDAMLEIYHRRKAGASVSKEATETTHNQAYWFGILSALDL